MTRSHWYDRQGNPIDWAQASELLGDMDARRVALDRVGGYVVSTVFLVIDHGFGSRRPVLFETMVFPADDWDGVSGTLVDIDGQRYCTEAEAVQGHADMVTLVRATQADERQP